MNLDPNTFEVVKMEEFEKGMKSFDKNRKKKLLTLNSKKKRVRRVLLHIL